MNPLENSSMRARAHLNTAAAAQQAKGFDMAPTQRPSRSVSRLAVFFVLHLVVLSLAWAVATLVSHSHTDLSAGGSHLRLIPLTGAR